VLLEQLVSTRVLPSILPARNPAATLPPLGSASTRSDRSFQAYEMARASVVVPGEQPGFVPLHQAGCGQFDLASGGCRTGDDQFWGAGSEADDDHAYHHRLDAEAFGQPTGAEHQMVGGEREDHQAENAQ
jgi:hypothetical protein